ncbi:MAG: hypothetical protein JST00_13485 [Deltaproteobacteria bacterium]|nr:hypothetical protein [Deltaproteobacteria bacterium]
MGAERLTWHRERWPRFAAFALCLSALGCAGAAPPPAPPSRVTLSSPKGARGAHQQIVRALTAPQRAEIVARLRERNGPAWSVTLGAGGAPDDVDPILGVVRRAKNEGPPGAPVELGEAVAIAEGEAFLRKNADLLGIAPDDVDTLDLAAGPARTNAYGAWVVHARGTAPTKGYEAFDAVTSAIDVLLYLGEDAKVRYFVNLSRVHPRLVLDTHPLLQPDDDRVTKDVVGRPLFVAIDDGSRPGMRVRELTRVVLGPATKDDVRAVRLTIHVSSAPRAAYVSYFLAYVVDVVKRRQPFRFVVDADTGDLLEDAVVPVLPPDALGPP